MNRDEELRRNGHLYEIASVNDEVLGSRQGFPAAEDGYRRVFNSVFNIAGPDLMDEVAASIKHHIRTHEERPTNQAIQKMHEHLSQDPDIPLTTTSTQLNSTPGRAVLP